MLQKHSKQPFSANQVHYTIGTDIYVGWVAGFIALITCVALLFGGCNSDDDEDDYEDNYNMVSTYSYTLYQVHFRVIEQATSQESRTFKTAFKE